MKLKRRKSAPSVRYLSAEVGRRRILAARPPRGNDAWSIRMRRIMVVFVLLGLLSGAVVGMHAGLKWTGRVLLWENDAYRASVINVFTDGRLPRENVLEFLNLPEEMNLWQLILARDRSSRDGSSQNAVNIARARERFLARVPSVSDMNIAVFLPDRIDIRVKERVPFAILNTGTQPGALVIDRHGIVFFDPHRDEGLPVLSGLPDDGVRPGDDMSAELTAALRFMDTVRRPRFSREIRIRRVHVAGDQLECWLDTGAYIRLAWPDMHELDLNLMERDLELKLESLLAVLRDSRDSGRQLVSIDLTLTEDNIPAIYR